MNPFLKHFRLFSEGQENELRKLRKLTTEFEEQNAILSKHIDNMKRGIDKLEGERAEQQSEISMLKRNLTRLQQILVKDFANLQVPGLSVAISLESVDTFLKKLQQHIQEQPKGNTELVSQVKAIIAKMDYPK